MTFSSLLAARVGAAFALAHALTAAAQGTDADILAAKAAFDTVSYTHLTLPTSDLV